MTKPAGKPHAAPEKSTSAPRQTSVSLKQLAKHLGLSPTTVSRVMTRSAAASRIPENTQNRILAAAGQLNYKPNAFASGLRNKRSFTIGVMVPEISEGYSTMVLSGIEDALLGEGFFYFVVSHRHRRELLDGYPHLLLSRSVEGIIAIDTLIKEHLPVPVIAVSGHKQLPGVVNIELDHIMAARYALTHLRDLGHRKIAFIKGQSFSMDTMPRWKAIQKVSASLGIKIDQRLVEQLTDSSPGTGPGYAATQRLLAKDVPFTAIFAFNDLSAIGAITALHEAGVRVPQSVSVVGFDDILSASTNNPGLTTVRQPLKEMGAIAATTMLDSIQGKSELSPGKSITVLPALVVRKSTSNVHR